jgi:hypothetical protein
MIELERESFVRRRGFQLKENGGMVGHRVIPPKILIVLPESISDLKLKIYPAT